LKIGVDTNVLVYAHMPAMPEHATVRARLHALLRSDDVELCTSSLVLHELVHVITDARRFDPPVSMPEALATARLYVGRRNVECLPVHEDAIRRALDLLEEHGLGRKRVADTLFAATLLTHGVTHLLTCNVSDYALFDELTLEDPRAAG
jgi:predicted nucleic acid-binding protein